MKRINNSGTIEVLSESYLDGQDSLAVYAATLEDCYQVASLAKRHSLDTVLFLVPILECSHDYEFGFIQVSVDDFLTNYLRDSNDFELPQGNPNSSNKVAFRLNQCYIVCNVNDTMIIELAT